MRLDIFWSSEVFFNFKNVIWSIYILILNNDSSGSEVAPYPNIYSKWETQGLWNKPQLTSDFAEQNKLDTKFGKTLCVWSTLDFGIMDKG